MITFFLFVELISYKLLIIGVNQGNFLKIWQQNMAAQAVVIQDCRASGVNLERNLIQTSLGRLYRGFYVLFCVLNVPWQ
jgi:hypothetical protein